MGILEKEVWVSIGSPNVKYYEGMGYYIPRKYDKRGRLHVPKGTKILVKIEDVTRGCNSLVTKICDTCGYHVENQIYHSVYKSRQRNNGTDICMKCLRTGDVVAIADKEFAKLFYYKEDTLKYAPQSRSFADFKCPTCGKKVENKRIQSVYRSGVNCNTCSDGISYPEKYVYSILSQMDIEFETQKSFSWSNRKVYDFYVETLNCIIEVHGEQHYKNTGFGRKTLDEEQKNDEYKMNLAKKHGVKKYIVVDCRKSNSEFIKNSILENEGCLSILDINKINWLECRRFAANSSLIKTVCDQWNQGKTVKDISKFACIDKVTVVKYLKRGVGIGLCDYSAEKSIKLALEQRTKRVVSVNENGIVCEFDSVKHVSEITGINENSIRRVCNGKGKTAGGYKWMYKDVYDDLYRNNCFIPLPKFQARKIVQVTIENEFVKEWGSLSGAEKSLGISNISKTCNGLTKTAGGYKWMYKEDYDKYIEEKNNSLIHIG